MSTRAPSGSQKRRRRRIPLHEAIQAEVAGGRSFCSFEYSPARDRDPEVLFSRVQRMVRAHQPLWVDVTWGFGDVGSKTLEACRRIRKELDVEVTLRHHVQSSLRVLMHLILTDTPLVDIDASLEQAKSAGVRSILALRGYTQAGYSSWQPLDPAHGEGLNHAEDLVRHIRGTHGQTFSLGVAGFPEGHPESKKDRFVATETELDRDVAFLKQKVDAGADFVVCQFTFDPHKFGAFVRRCRAAHITVPILPGIMPISEHASTRLLSHTWGVKLPTKLEQRLRDVAGNVDMIHRLGQGFVTELCHRLLSPPDGTLGCPGLHFYVYDNEYEVGNILQQLHSRGVDLAAARPDRPSDARLM